MSNRFYFDYNATSPLSNKVVDFLRSGDFLFGNPASLHQTGKRAKKFINETSAFLFDLFSLEPTHFNLVYHSGATEGINSVFKGLALKAFRDKRRISFFFSVVDHACAFNLKEDLELLGHEAVYFTVDTNGNFDVQGLIEQMLMRKKEGRDLACNFTYVNNETGIVWPLERAEQVKKATGAFVHVDAVQLVGKIKEWKILSGTLDAYTFSGHKFGAMKGVGFTFIKKEISISPLLTGGNQQAGMRSGTENALGIYSLKLALEDVLEHFDFDELKRAFNLIENELLKVIGERGEIIGAKNNNRNLTTCFLMLRNQKAEILSAKFDMLGMDVSTGSACSSGVIKENRILRAMGYNEEESRSAIRFSFSPFMNSDEAIVYVERMTRGLS